ncbi:MAG: NTP transferase domain-containing protein [Candidatus Sungbacteria bacterium]|nr:NTP transferase domain-containing protein [Candidatus Sungbacteria bacterium]
MELKGIILAGGKGTRLMPATLVMNKHLIPVLNKPMILYPLETLTKVFGIKEIMLISSGEHIGQFANFLGDGSAYGCSLTYRVQKDAGGIAQALGLARNFADTSRSIVILGDNIFDNGQLAKDAGDFSPKDDACVFLKEVEDAHQFGVPTFSSDMAIDLITEKPAHPSCNVAVVGLYSFPPDVFEIIKTLKPSQRGELEITEVNNSYAKRGKLTHKILTGFWSDAGTQESLARTTKWAFSNL